MIEYKEFDNGFEYVEISNAAAHARIALQGGHLFHYKRTAEDPLLWLSNTSFFKPGKAIRGGVPICWPWFGKYPDSRDLPQHGFARTSVWKLHSSKESNASETEVLLKLQHSEESLKLWPHRFELLLHITIGEILSIALTTRNCDDKPFTVSSALHSYFAVSDIGAVSVDKLQNTSCFDSLSGDKGTQQGIITFGEEFDRIYQDVQYPLTLKGQKRDIQIDAQGSSSAIVWNPWVDKCGAMVDMEDDGYKTMLCIETANAGRDSRLLAPGDEHTLRTDISCLVYRIDK